MPQTSPGYTRRRGYCGLAVWRLRNPANLGMLLRVGFCFDVDFIALIDTPLVHHPANTPHAERHVPVFHYKSLDDFYQYLPHGCAVIGIEVNGKDIRTLHPPDRCVYLFGGESETLPPKVQPQYRIPTRQCLNVAVAAAVVMYDRIQRRLPPVIDAAIPWAQGHFSKEAQYEQSDR